MFRITRSKEPEPMDVSVEAMMEWMRQNGDPTLVVCAGHWWCYFKYKKGPIEIQIQADGDRSKMTMHQQVEGCYNNVRKAMNALGATP